MDIFKLFGKIAIENDEANRAIDETTGIAEKSESRMSSAFKKIGAAVATYFAVDKIKDFGQACVDMSAEVAAEQSAFEQIMGDYSDAAQEKVNEIADATGMVDTRLTPYMTSMTAKFKGLGYDIGDATDYAQQGLTIAADAAAFWDKSLDDSMSALNSFVNGSYEGGEAIGLFANDTQMAAYAVKTGLISESKEWANLDEKIKQATRLEYAENMQKASGAVGQAAKESGQYANVQANLNEKWRQFKAQVGEPILQDIVLPAMEKLSGFITDKLMPGVEKFTDYLSEDLIPMFWETCEYLAEELSPILSDIGEAIIPVIKKAIQSVKDILYVVVPVIKNIWDIAEPIFDVVVDALELILEYLPTLLKDVLDLVDPLNLIHEETSQVSEEYLKMAENAEKMSDQLDEIKDKNSEIGQSVLDEYGYYEDLNERLSTVVDKNGKIKEHCEYTVQQIIDELNPALGTSLEIVNGQLQGYKDISDKIDEIIMKKEAEAMLESGLENYNEAVTARAEAIKAKVAAETEISECEAKIAEIKKNQDLYFETGEIAEGFDLSAAYGDIQRLEENIYSLNNTVKTETKNINGFNNEITKYSDLQNAYMEGNLGAMQRFTAEYSYNMLTAGNATVEELNAQYDEFSQTVDNLVTAQKNGDTSVTNEMIDTYTKLRNISHDELTEAKELAKTQGEETCSKFRQGVENSTDSVISTVHGLTSEVNNEFDNLDTYSAGMEMINRLDSGIRDAAASLYSTAYSVANTLKETLSNISVGVSASVSSSSSSKPHMAKGGIVTRATEILSGEDGPEAIVPLENNTEWIDKVAAKVTDSMGGAPSNSAILSKLTELIDVIKEQKVYLDSGVLVGEIAPAMDSELGNISRMKRRGLR